jgi:competence protein ComEA
MRRSAVIWFSAYFLPIAAVGALVHAERFRAHPGAIRPPPAPIDVSVQGAVRQPGRVTLPHGASLADALRLSGGLAPGAQTGALKLDAPLHDEQTVVVPGPADPVWTVSLNHATTLELDHLPGIGPALAARIEAGRPYARVDDLIDVPGIGPATLEKLLPHVTP